MCTQWAMPQAGTELAESGKEALSRSRNQNILARNGRTSEACRKGTGWWNVVMKDWVWVHWLSDFLKLTYVVYQQLRTNRWSMETGQCTVIHYFRLPQLITEIIREIKTFSVLVYFKYPKCGLCMIDKETVWKVNPKSSHHKIFVFPFFFFLLLYLHEKMDVTYGHHITIHINQTTCCMP